jgi:hypothetical protein
VVFGVWYVARCSERGYLLVSIQMKENICLQPSLFSFADPDASIEQWRGLYEYIVELSKAIDVVKSRPFKIFLIE